MTRKFDEQESLLPKSHWECQKCGKQSNLIRPVDVTKQTFCKDCLKEMRACLDHALQEQGVKWHLKSIFEVIEKTETNAEKIFLINHILSSLCDRIEDINFEDLHERT